MTFPTEWKVIIQSCSKPPTSFSLPGLQCFFFPSKTCLALAAFCWTIPSPGHLWSEVSCSYPTRPSCGNLHGSKKFHQTFEVFHQTLGVWDVGKTQRNHPPNHHNDTWVTHCLRGKPQTRALESSTH